MTAEAAESAETSTRDLILADADRLPLRHAAASAVKRPEVREKQKNDLGRQKLPEVVQKRSHEIEPAETRVCDALGAIRAIRVIRVRLWQLQL